MDLMQYFSPDYAMYYLIGNLLWLALFALIWIFSGQVTWLWIKAGLSKRPILIEWTKNRTWRFHVPTLDKGVPEMWEVDSKNRGFQARREAIGPGPHRIALGTAVSEHPTLVSVLEATGEKYFSTNQYFWGVKFNDGIQEVSEPTKEEADAYVELNMLYSDPQWIKDNPDEYQERMREYQILQSKHVSWETKKLWIRYPDHLAQMDLFANFQQVEPDPRIQAAYARQKVIEEKVSQNNLFAKVQDNLHWFGPFIVICLIAFYWLQMNNAALSATQDVITCKNQLAQMAAGCGDHAINLLRENVSIASGGRVT